MSLFLTLAVVITGYAAWTDFRTGQIPNWLTASAVLAGVIGHFVRGWVVGGLWVGAEEAGVSLAGLLFCSVAPALMFYKGAMGGGDVKLFAAVGALCQPLLGIEVEMYALVIAALVAPAKLAYEGKLLRVLGNSLAMLVNPLRPRDKRREIPSEMMTWFRLGPAIFAGALLTFLIHGAMRIPS